MSKSDWPDITPELMQKLDDAVPELCPHQSGVRGDLDVCRQACSGAHAAQHLR